MNLNISYNWLKEHISTKDDASEFAKKITISGPTVDHITPVTSTFKKVVTGEILSIEKHPNADKLNVCQVNVGGKSPLNIVCGAPNIEIGQKVPVVLVGGEVSGLQIKKTKLRGIESEGMMCSQKELGIGDDHSGIYILPEYTKLGLALEKVMPLDDHIFDMEVTSNRPDAMNIIGIAREASAAGSGKFLYKPANPSLKTTSEKKLSVSVKESKTCPRYQSVVLTNVAVGSSPLWMQQRLLFAGHRPINNLVDITNYVLMEFGQPMHVFDYDKLNGQQIIVRNSKKGEQILALDGKNYELTENSLVIADSKSPVAVAGVMGGELSAATGGTTTIVLESANFDPLSVRKTSRALNLYSDSSSLFEKGLAPENTMPALLRAIELVSELAGGRIASKIFDESSYKTKDLVIDLNPEEVTQMLGIEIKVPEITSILESLGFEISGKTPLKVTVPWWRHRDVEETHDLIEEVARVYGYHKLPSQLMAGSIPVDNQENKEFKLEDKAKDVLVGLGYSENINYSFISEKLITNCFLRVEDHVTISNPLSGDFEYMRTSLMPGILQSVKENERISKNLNIFELSRVYIDNKNDLPDELTSLVIAMAEEKKEKAFFDIKGSVSALLQKLNISDFTFDPSTKVAKYWNKHESATISVGGKSIGVIGTVNSETLNLFHIKKSVAVAEIDFATLMTLAQDSPSYKPIAKFPGSDLDISMELNEKILYMDIENTILDIDPLIKQVLFLSVYQGENIPKGKKALAIRVHYRNDEKTVLQTEVQSVHEKVVDKLKKEYNITIR
jgi:phenylalanyl-tRNA synthetase beta chain